MKIHFFFCIFPKFVGFFSRDNKKICSLKFASWLTAAQNGYTVIKSYYIILLYQLVRIIGNGYFFGETWNFRLRASVWYALWVHNLLYFVFPHWFENQWSQVISISPIMIFTSINKVCFHIFIFTFHNFCEGRINDFLVRLFFLWSYQLRAFQQP